MKRIGIVGGIAWLSTVDYYSDLCRRSEERHLAGQLPGLPSTPEISIESLDLNRAFAYLGSDGDEASWTRYDKYHHDALQRVEASGADFALMASNTPHHRFASIVRGIGIPVINIFDAVANTGAEIGASEVLILGTGLTMSSAVFRQAFAKHGVRANGPQDEAARTNTIDLIGQLQRGKVEGAAETLGQIAASSFGQFKAQPLVCLACTELPLAFPDKKKLATFEHDGITYLNTSAAHIDAAFALAIGE
jgi:aspartate racemase